MSGFAEYNTKTLLQVRANLRAGLDKVAGHLDAGTFHDVGDKGKAPPAESGRLTLALLLQVDAELERRRKTR